MTLRELIEQHPDWLDYKMAILRPNGYLDYVGASGDMYISSDYDKDENLTGNKVIVFTGN